MFWTLSHVARRFTRFVGLELPLPVRISVIVTWANVVAVMVRAAVPIIEMKRIVYSP